MSISMKVSNALASKKFNYATKGMFAAVVGMTALKAVGRPAFIMADKNSDPETKKYTAVKEALYQILCLGLTFGMVIPGQKLGFNMAKKHLGKFADKIKDLKTFEKVATDFDELTEDAVKILGQSKLDDSEKLILKKVKGGGELGSFVGSILGLTIVAPLIGHKMLHPIMSALGMDKKESPNPALEKLEQPILSEGHHKKVDTTV